MNKDCIGWLTMVISFVCLVASLCMTWVTDTNNMTWIWAIIGSFATSIIGIIILSSTD